MIEFSLYTRVDRLRQEMLLKALVSLGLTKVDAEIYLLLAKEGPQQGRSIVKSLELYKQQLYRSLKSLQKKGAVNATLERPARFSAVSLEKVLDFLIEAKKEQALALQESREELLSNWKSITKKEFADT
jgi:sugar-specific transcriptional regulator TrmB